MQVTIDPTSQSDSAGENLIYLVTVTNTGDLADTYDLTAEDDAGWSVELAVGSCMLDPGESRSGIRLTVTIPENAESGDSTTVIVTATSQADPSIENSATCTAEVAGGGIDIVLPVAGVIVVIVVIIGAILVIRPF